MSLNNRKLLAVFLFIVVLGAPFTTDILRFFGWHLTTDEKGLATYLIEHNLSVEECKGLIFFDPFAPQVGEKRLDCIVEYARQKKNPTICERLMPSDYGMNCVGAAIDFKRPCALGNDMSVSGNGIDATLYECLHGPSDIQNNSCCILSKARFIKSFNECPQEDNNADIQDECHYNIAFKNHDETECASIDNENLRAACEVFARGLKKDPSICKGCTPPVDDIEDLPK